MISELLWVGLGGALGSMIRYAATLAMQAYSTPHWIVTMSINVVGSFIIGILISLPDKGTLYLFTAIGICGGFTTFSTFSAQTVELIQNHHYATAFIYALLSLILCLSATAWALHLTNKIQ